MIKSILNKNGTAFIGLLVSVLVIALVFFGSFYFFKGKNSDVDDLVKGNAVDVYKDAKEKIAAINDDIKAKNETGNKALGDDMVFDESNFEKWHVLKRENENFEIKYPQSWYYTINHQEAMEGGYEIIIGFEPSEKIWEQEPPYEIELVVSSKEVTGNGFTYTKEIKSEGDKKFYIRTGKNNTEADYDVFVDQMIETFTYIK